MAFDGPGPFDGDPVFNHLDRVSGQPASVVRTEVAAAFQEVIEGGAARRIPAELVSMLGLDPSSSPAVYIDVDEGVWAWACAEMVAVALGHEPESRMPEPFHRAAKSIPDPLQLVADALAAIDILSDTKQSELAALLKEANATHSRKRIANLRDALQRHRLRAV